VPIDVEWVQLSGGAAVNDALLSGSIDVAGAGVGPLLTIWDRTAGKPERAGVASLGNFPYYLVSTNPAVKTIADFSEGPHRAAGRHRVGAGAHPADGRGQAVGHGAVHALDR
jgi:ABC-type nitrate/sulfonate/bicarbonate transport system substrate-binding protein